MIFAVDPGSKGAIVWGSPGAATLSYEQIPQIKGMNDIDEIESFSKKWTALLRIVEANIRPDSIFVIERTEPFFSAKTNAFEVLAATRLAREQGRWDIVGLGIRRFNPTPATWRKSIFGGARAHKGREWKSAELDLAIRRFPGMGWGKYLEFRPVGDHHIYGLAAACGIWCYGEKLLLKGGE